MLRFSGTREQAFVYAIASASLTHSVARACSIGITTKCTCGALPNEAPQGDFKWGGCGDDVDFGLDFSKAFIGDKEDRRKKSMMNRHNSAAGRKVMMIMMMMFMFVLMMVIINMKMIFVVMMMMLVMMMVMLLLMMISMIDMMMMMMML